MSKRNQRGLEPGPRSDENHYYVPFFTGVYCGRHYWRGALWLGPTNAVGHGRVFLLDRQGEKAREVGSVAVAA